MTALDRAIKKAGGRYKLGKLIGTSHQRIKYWQDCGGKRVPAEMCKPIEDATGIGRHLLRPDIFGARAAAE